MEFENCRVDEGSTVGFLRAAVPTVLRQRLQTVLPGHATFVASLPAVYAEVVGMFFVKERRDAAMSQLAADRLSVAYRLMVPVITDSGVHSFDSLTRMFV
jgi:hypothetical protein